MKKVLSLMLVMVLTGILFAACTPEEDTKDVDTEDKTTEETDSAEETEEAEEATGPIPFSEVGMGIMDAADTYAKFTFEDVQGDCYDSQGFPTDLYYDSENVILTEDGSYMEDFTSVDFTGRISFDEVPLTDGAAACEISTKSGIDNATLSCEIEEEEVCTGNFKVYAHN